MLIALGNGATPKAAIAGVAEEAGANSGMAELPTAERSGAGTPVIMLNEPPEDQHNHCIGLELRILG